MIPKNYKEKYQTSYYCFDCKKYFIQECAKPQGFHTCHKCGKMNVLEFFEDYDYTVGFEIQDDLCIQGYTPKRLKQIMKIMIKLMEKAKNNS